MPWDPHQYGRFARARARPFLDLVSQIHAEAPGRVVDIGCGRGDLTASLADRWPGAKILGIDSSAEMLAQAPERTGVHFELGDATGFDAGGVDVLLSNAALQWVPEHRELIVSWAAQLNPGGWLAFQVPDQHDAPSHRLMRELARSPRWRAQLGAVSEPIAVARPVEYLELLQGAGWSVDVWQTEYFQVLAGPDSVLEWVRGTSLRPLLAALDDDDAGRFFDEYAAALREAYPSEPWGTPYPFRWTFVVAQSGSEQV